MQSTHIMFAWILSLACLSACGPNQLPPRPPAGGGTASTGAQTQPGPGSQTQAGPAASSQPKPTASAQAELQDYGRIRGWVGTVELTSSDTSEKVSALGTARLVNDESFAGAQSSWPMPKPNLADPQAYILSMRQWDGNVKAEADNCQSIDRAEKMLVTLAIGADGMYRVEANPSGNQIGPYATQCSDGAGGTYQGSIKVPFWQSDKRPVPSGSQIPSTGIRLQGSHSYTDSSSGAEHTIKWDLSPLNSN